MATARQLPADVSRNPLAFAAAETRDLELGTAKGLRSGNGATFGTLEARGASRGLGGLILRMPKLAKPLGDVNRRAAFRAGA